MAGAPKEMVGRLFGGSDILSTSCQCLWKRLYDFWMKSVSMCDGHESIVHMKLESGHRVSKALGVTQGRLRVATRAVSSYDVPRCNGCVRESLTIK